MLDKILTVVKGAPIMLPFGVKIPSEPTIPVLYQAISIFLNIFGVFFVVFEPSKHPLTGSLFILIWGWDFFVIAFTRDAEAWYTVILTTVAVVLYTFLFFKRFLEADNEENGDCRWLLGLAAEFKLPYAVAFDITNKNKGVFPREEIQMLWNEFWGNGKRRENSRNLGLWKKEVIKRI